MNGERKNVNHPFTEILQRKRMAISGGTKNRALALLSEVLTNHRNELISAFNASLRSQIPKLHFSKALTSKVLDIMLKSIQENDAQLMISAITQISSLERPKEGPTVTVALVNVLYEMKYALLQFVGHNVSPSFREFFLKMLDSWNASINADLIDQLQSRLSEQFSEETRVVESKNESIMRLKATMAAMLGATGDYFIMVFDANQKLIECSKGVETIFGYTPHEILGKRAESLAPLWSSSDEENLLIAKSIETTGRFEGELLFHHKDGHDLTAQITIVTIQNAEGEAIGTLGIGRDISEEKRMKEQLLKYTSDLQLIAEERGRDLEESEERYRYIVEEINEGYFVSRGDKLTFVNKAFARITGYNRSDLQGRSLLDFLLKGTRIEPKAWWRKVGLGETSGAMEFLIKRKDGNKAIVELKAQAAVIKNEAHVIGVMNDITEKKKMERQLRRYVDNLEKMVTERTHELQDSVNELKTTQDQLIESEKLAGIGIIAAGVAHEINNPLQALVLKSQHILRQPDNIVEVKRTTQDIIKYVNRMAEIVRGLSNYARSVKSEDKPIPVDLEEIVKEALELAYHMRSFNDLIVKREFDKVAFVQGNRGKFQQVFINLIVNAIDAMDGRGRLVLRLRDYGKQFVLAEVEDTGCGIPQENLDLIMTPLFTTKPSGKGTGMGLHVVQRIIQDFGGELKVHSNVGVGTTFSILFRKSSELESGKNVAGEQIYN